MLRVEGMAGLWFLCLGLLVLPGMGQEEGPPVVTEQRDGTISIAADRDSLRLVVAQLQRYATRSIQLDDSLGDVEVTMFLSNVTPIDALRELADMLNMVLDESGDQLLLSADLSGSLGGGNPGGPGVDLGGDTALYFIPLQNLTLSEAADLTGYIGELVGQSPEWTVSEMPRRNGYVLRATEEVHEEVLRLCAKFDVPSVMETRIYKLKYYAGEGSFDVRRDGVGNIGTTSGEGGEDLDVETGLRYNLQELLEGFLSGGDGTSLHILETESLVIATDYPHNLDRIEALLDQIDKRPRQVLLEVTILQLSIDDGHQLGVDFNTLDGIDFNSIFTGGVEQTVRGTDLSSLATNTGPVGGGANLDDGVGSLSYSSPRDVTDGGLQLGVIKNKVAVFVDAVETIAEVSVTANPKILALDRHRSEIHIGDRLGFTTSDIDVSGGSTTTQETIEFLDTGIKLTFTPFIADNGYVRLLLAPKRSSGIIDANGVPQEEVAELSVNAIVRSGHTLVIGGLMEEVSQNNVNQIPFLGDIPFLGWLFKRQRGSIRKEEIVFLITPYVVNDEDMEEISTRVWAEMEEKRREFESHIWIGNRMRRSYLLLGADGDPRDTDSIARTEWALSLNPLHPTALDVRDQILARRGEQTMVEKLEQNLDLFLHTDPGYWSDRGTAFHPRRTLPMGSAHWNPNIWPEEEDPSDAPSDTATVAVVPEETPGASPWIPEGCAPRTPWWEPSPAQAQAAELARCTLAVESPLGLELAFVPGGTFWIGSDEDEPGRSTNEALAEVTLSQPLYAVATEVTQALWTQVMGTTPFNFKDLPDDVPAEQITWFDAVEFCNKLSEAEGITPAYTIADPVRSAEGRLESATVSLTDGALGYRLPTEAEWERACRAGTRSAYAVGAELGDGDARFNAGEGGGELASVRSYEPNPYGLYDMHGNVAEWCWDWYARARAAEVDPAGPATGMKKVYRGGSYLVKASHCRSAYREQFEPGGFIFYLGLRPVRSVPAEEQR